MKNFYKITTSNWKYSGWELVNPKELYFYCDNERIKKIIEQIKILNKEKETFLIGSEIISIQSLDDDIFSEKRFTKYYTFKK